MAADKALKSAVKTPNSPHSQMEVSELSLVQKDQVYTREERRDWKIYNDHKKKLDKKEVKEEKKFLKAKEKLYRYQLKLNAQQQRLDEMQKRANLDEEALKRKGELWRNALELEREKLRDECRVLMASKDNHRKVLGGMQKELHRAVSTKTARDRGAAASEAHSPGDVPPLQSTINM